MADELKIQQ